MDNLIIFFAKYLIFIVVLITIAVFLQMKGKARWQLTVTVITAGILAVVMSKLAGKLYFHHRPFVVNHVTPLVPHGDDNSFPSDHTVLATTLAAAIYFYRRTIGEIALALAVLVGLGRVWAHVHWPVDILGGLVIGALAGWAGYRLAKKLTKITNSSSKPKELDPHT